jgi:hypothetical protein
MFGQQDGQDDGMQPQHQDLMPSGPMNDSMMQNGMSSNAMGNQAQSAPSNDTQSSDDTSNQPQAAPAASTSSREADAAAPEDLISIKQDALQNLKPLVGHLDQSPEEAFRMTMMMIQATDDQSLIPKAYDLAKSITDEKARAQALLDVVNEINYFTAQSSQAAQ